jgi:transcriptional regulator with XRE-family HTH domain
LHICPKAATTGPVVDDDDLGGFGERLRTARERLEMGQSALADAVRTDVGTVSRWERGRAYPHAQQLARLALALGESLDYLVLGVTPERAPTVMPPAFLEFLRTEHGRIAQRRAYLHTLLSVHLLREPTVAFYQAFTAGLMMDDDD